MMEVITYATDQTAGGVGKMKTTSFASKMKTKLRRATASKTKLADQKTASFADVSNGQTQRQTQKTVKVLKPTIKESTYDLSKLKTEVELMLDSKLPAGVKDIDADEVDYFNEPTYAQDIMSYLRAQEQYFVIPRNYLDGKEVTHVMRSVLVDWLLQVQDHLDLQQETVHLAVSMVNHFLHRRIISVNKIQLMGVTCLLIAAKYVERFAPEIEDLVRLTDNTYKYADLIQMELVVLKVLRYELYMSTPCVFLDRFLKLVKNEEQVSVLCRYLLDLSLADPTCAVYPGSIMAAGALALARTMVATEQGTSDEWTYTDAYYTGYLGNELLPVMRRYVKLLQRLSLSKQQGAKAKYSSRSRFQAIAKSDMVTSQPNLNRILEALGSKTE